MPQPLKIHIASRYVPIAGRAGHFTYLLEMMRYLHSCGYPIELDVLDPWFKSNNIPEYITHIANVAIMPESLIRTQPLENWRFRALFRSVYAGLPMSLLAPLRKAWYWLRQREIPGHHLPDAVATEAELAFVNERVSNNHPNVLITNETFLGNILTAYQNNRTLLKIDIAFDLHHQRYKTFQASGISARCSAWNRQKETDLLMAADLVITIHDEDTQTLRNTLSHSDVVCVPFPARIQPHDAAEQVAGRCLFVGSSIATNAHGLMWFLHEVWPLVLEWQPQATLHVCGTVCESLSHVHAPNVSLLGRVEDLKAEYGAAEVCVIPLIAGSGLKIKLVEALSHGRACVSTSVGVQGVRELADRAVLVADAPEEFAKAVISLLQRPERRNTMEDEARKYVEDHLTPEKAYQTLIERISHHAQAYHYMS